MTKKDDETQRVQYLLDIEYHYAAGELATRFFTELKEAGRIMGMRCSGCHRVYLPPRPVCGICYKELKDWVPLSDEGIIVGCTVVHLPFIDPMTGEQRPVPYGFAIIRLDGASTSIYHFVDETDEKKLRVGQRVKAVFREPRTGSLHHDIKYFRLVGK